MQKHVGILPKAVVALVIAMALAISVPMLSSNLSADPAGAQANNTKAEESAEAEEGEAIELLDDMDWDAFDRCLEDNFSEVELEADDDLTDEELDALEDRAMEACGDLLPEGIEDIVDIEEFEDFDDEDFAAFDECMGFDEEFEGEYGDILDTNEVIVLTADGEQIIMLGDDPATVSITSDGTNVDVATTGDANVIDLEAQEDLWAEEEAKFAECEALLPDDAAVHFAGEDAITLQEVTVD